MTNIPLSRIDFWLKALFYGAFVLLLLALLIIKPQWFLPVILTSGLSFGLVTILRRAINAPRPYEVSATSPAIPKRTSGRSFPSRHVFSAFMIASCWWTLTPWVSVSLLAGAIAIAVVRVAGGVHYPRDVVAGAILGIACAAIGLGVSTFIVG